MLLICADYVYGWHHMAILNRLKIGELPGWRATKRRDWAGEDTRDFFLADWSNPQKDRKVNHHSPLLGFHCSILFWGDEKKNCWGWRFHISQAIGWELAVGSLAAAGRKPLRTGTSVPSKKERGKTPVPFYWVMGCSSTCYCSIYGGFGRIKVSNEQAFRQVWLCMPYPLL